MGKELSLRNEFVAELSHATDDFEYPYRGKKLIADRKFSTAIAHSILRDTPSAALCPQLFPFLNLINSKRMIRALAAPGEKELTSCPVIVIDDQSESPSTLPETFPSSLPSAGWARRAGSIVLPLTLRKLQIIRPITPRGQIRNYGFSAGLKIPRSLSSMATARSTWSRAPTAAPE